MWDAYSRLKFLLDERGMSRADLSRRIAAGERPFNVKSLYRLCDPDLPLERIDLRLAGAVCRVLDIGLTELIVFAEPEPLVLRTLAEAKQSRLDDLLDEHRGGRISQENLEQLRILVEEAEEIARDNAGRLATQRRRLSSSSGRAKAS